MNTTPSDQLSHNRRRIRGLFVLGAVFGLAFLAFIGLIIWEFSREMEPPPALPLQEVLAMELATGWKIQETSLANLPAGPYRRSGLGLRFGVSGGRGSYRNDYGSVQVTVEESPGVDQLAVPVVNEEGKPGLVLLARPIPRPGEKPASVVLPSELIQEPFRQ